MEEILKNWIVTIFCIGIFITFVQMIIPNTKLKKYVYSLIGVISLIALIMPLKDKLKIDNLENITQSVVNNIEKESYDYDLTNVSSDITSQNLKKEFARKIKEDMKLKLNDYNIQPEMISVILDDSYNIKRVNVKITNQGQENMLKVTTIFNCISQNYNVLDNNITIEEV